MQQDTEPSAYTPKDFNAVTDLRSDNTYGNTLPPSTLKEAETFVKRFFQKHDTVTDKNHDQLAALLNRETLITLVDSILANPDDIEKIASQSYDNPLGFGKLVLIDGKHSGAPGFKLRVHTWYPYANNRELTEKPHEHHWDYASTIIAGSLENHKLIKRPLTEKEHGRTQEFLQNISGFSKDQKTQIADFFEMVETREAIRHNPDLGMVRGRVDQRDKNWRQNFENDYQTALASTRALFSDACSERDLEFFSTVFKKYLTIDVVHNGAVVADKYERDTDKDGNETFFRLERPTNSYAHIIKANQLYYGSVRSPHKLSAEIGEFSTTMMLTAPKVEGWKSGRFVHLTRDKAGESTNYRHYTESEVREQLEDLATNLRVEKYTEAFWFKHFSEQRDPVVKGLKIDSPGLLNDVLIPRIQALQLEDPAQWRALQKEWRGFIETQLDEAHDHNAHDLTHAGIHGNVKHVCPALDMMLGRSSPALN